jgi:phosphoglycerate dehydrogenase-like enzyme
MSNTTAIDLLVTFPLSTEILETLQSVSPRLRVTVHPAQTADDIPAEVWARCEVLYTARVLPTRTLAPQLKWIQFYYAGINHAISAPIMQDARISATTMSGASASQMAEYVLGMLLALGHRLPALIENQNRAEWPENRWERFLPQELRDSTVGIVGYGSIGRQIARLLHPFGATVLATKFNAMQPADSGYRLENQGDADGTFVHRLYPHQALRSMARDCDFLVVTAPLTSSTRGAVNAEVFAALPPHACLIDVSRGGIVDHGALLDALENNRLHGAALDVFPTEPLSPGSPLWDLPNVIITPHISGNSPHYAERAADLFSANLQRYLANQPLYNLVDLEKGY